MFNISNFLKKYTSIEDKNRNIKLVIYNSILKHTKITLNDGDFEYKNGSIVLKINPTVKTAILIKKDKIIEEVNKVLSINIRELK